MDAKTEPRGHWIQLFDFLAAGSEAALPLPARLSCQATSIGAATAMDE
jgi:hypothetical protein